MKGELMLKNLEDLVSKESKAYLTGVVGDLNNIHRFIDKCSNGSRPIKLYLSRDSGKITRDRHVKTKHSPVLSCGYSVVHVYDYLKVGGGLIHVLNEFMCLHRDGVDATDDLSFKIIPFWYGNDGEEFSGLDSLVQGKEERALEKRLDFSEIDHGLVFEISEIFRGWAASIYSLCERGAEESIENNPWAAGPDQQPLL